MPSNETRYPHKDSHKIDMVSKETLAKQHTFKNAKMTNSEWLMKKNPVRQATNPDYHPHKGNVEY